MDLDPDAKTATENKIDAAPDSALLLGRAKPINLTKERRAEALILINAMKLRGNTTLVGIANELNKRGVPAPRGGLWTATQISRII
jgi:Recombinase